MRSEETKKKQSASMKAAWALRKANKEIPKKKGFLESILQIFKRKK